ncbi:MAG: DUF1566 domain-containing protein [SAR324 cluster bacterium]|nr:DUF1566 domain-containing protein [SAR324 cluster bacterium]
MRYPLPLLISAILLLCSTTLHAGYTDNGNGSIADTSTGLMWQKEDDNSTRTWEAALSYCEALSLGSQTDWRLPNVRELASIVDAATHSPAINSTYFPNTNSSGYWSSSSNAYDSSYAWYVHFSYGDVGYYFKSNTSSYVRCVRGGL